MTKIFIDNNWQEYDYDTLYSERGYTNTPSTMLVVYDNSMVQLDGWSNTGFNWIEQDHQWYPNDETPYYVQQSSSISLYKIDKKTNFKTYLNNNEPFIIYNNSFTTIETLHDNLGYTETPSTVWGISDGVPWSWYNSDNEEYWNDKTHEWTTNPPKEEDEGESEILPNPIPLIEVDTFSEMDPPIRIAGVEACREYYPVPNWTQGNLLDPVEIDVLPPISACKDTLETDITLYVIDEDGVDLQGVHYNFADPITHVDKFSTLVFPEGDETFYYQDLTYSFSYLYDSLSLILKHYWREDVSRYYTESELLGLGYAKTPFTKVYATDSDQQIQNIIELWYNEDHGYYYNGDWYLTEQDLNNAGYYLVEKVIQELYVGPYDWQSWYYDYRVTRNSTSFRLTGNYIMNLWLDNERTQPFLYDGKNWKFDIGETAKYKTFSNPVSALDQMPTSTTSGNDRYTLLSVITQSGNPISPLVQSDLGLQMRGHLSTNYYSDLSTTTNFKIVASYWKYVDKVLSFANTQLPDIIIDLPQSIIAESGSIITLPTMSGEYESGGKTWIPKAWDIGVFGDSYTLNADTVAHLIFEEVQQYEEVTLYMQSGSKYGQDSITSGFTGDVNSVYCYQLYTDEQRTTLWNGYDYSNDYELGYYENGVWKSYIDSISEMPDEVGSTTDFIGYILMDTGCLWIVTNAYFLASTAVSSITLRIYPKDQQVFALYFNTSSVYNNISMTYDSAYDMYGSPNTGTSPIPLTSNFPDKDIIGVYGSAGNLVSSRYKNFAWAGSSKMRVGYYNTDAGTLSARLLLFTTDQYIDIAYINTSGDTSVSSGTAMRLYSKDGNYLVYFPSLFTYTPLALFKYNGSCADDSSGHYINMTTLGNYTGPSDALCLKQTYGRVSFSYIWYLRTPISQ